MTKIHENFPTFIELTPFKRTEFDELDYFILVIYKLFTEER